MSCANCNMPRRSCQVHSFLADDKAELVRKIRSKIMPVISENDTSSPQSSRANLGISQLSIPLAWNSDQHFKSKGECRFYSMFVVLQTKTKVVDSRMVTNIDRSMTDVVFPESFVFESEPDDFCVEVSIYAARTDQGLSDGGGSLRTKISRSLGRKFGNNVKAQLSTIDTSKIGQRPDSILGGTHFNLLARAYLVLTDAGDNCNIHDLKMSAFADLSGPPLYGHVICRLVVQPQSVLFPVAEGILTVKPLGEETPLKNVRSRLQAGNLHCFMNTDIHRCPSAEETLMLVPITAGSKIVSTAYPHTFLLCTEGTSDTEGSEIFITADNDKTKLAWKKAMEMQINDCEVWGRYAYTTTNLTFVKKQDPVKETMSRAAGNRLYDKISIAGTVSKGTTINLSPSMSYCPRELSPLRSPRLDASRTAPTKRTKQRTNILDVFPEVHRNDNRNTIIDLEGDSYTRTDSPPVYTPISNRMKDNSTIYDYSNRSKHYTDNTSVNSQYTDYSIGKSGKKSWSRSIGAYIGKKMAASSVQVTRL